MLLESYIRHIEIHIPMDLNDRIREAALEYLGTLDFGKEPPRENAGMLDYLHQGKILDDKSMESSLEKAIIQQARRDYDNIIKSKRSLKNYSRPMFLAYAMQTGEFSKKEIDKINFGKETREEFVEKNYNPNLVKLVRKDVLDPYHFLCCDEE
jgi:hypothetical protein